MHRCACTLMAMASLVGVGCGDDGRRGAPTDGGRVESDGATADDDGGAGDDGGPGLPADGGGSADAGDVDAGPAVPEDCDAPGDEDGNGHEDCEDVACWDTEACRAEELGLADVVGWMPCGEPVELDEEATTAICEDGAPGLFPPPERDLRCGRIPTTLVLQPYCEPGDGDGRALRYEGRMDTTSENEMIGPSTTRHVSFETRIGEGTLYTSYAGGGSSGAEPYPIRETWGAEGYRWIAWVTGMATGTQARILFYASETESTFTLLEDGGVAASYSDPSFYYTAGLDHSF